MRRGSKITSSLFRVSGSTNPSNVTKAKSSQTFFVKGKDDITYHHEGGADDIFTIKNSEGTFKLSRKDLRQALEDLKTQSNIPVKQLAPSYAELLESIFEALKFLYSSKELYGMIHSDIKDIFKDVKKAIPGTVAAFFIGCSVDKDFPGPMGCDPRCAASIPPGESVPGYSDCDDLVLAYINSMFSSINGKKSAHAYIYIGDTNFNGFPVEHIEQLKKEKIEKATLIFAHTDSDKSYKEISSPINIDKLPQKQEQIKETNLTQTNDVSCDSSAGIAIVVIIVIVIIVLLILLYQSTRQ